MLILKDVKYTVADERPRTYDYEPEYLALVYRRDGKPEVIIARSDCMVEKIWRPTIQKLIPESYCEDDTVNCRISICPVTRDGEVDSHAVGYLVIYGGRVLGPDYLSLPGSQLKDTEDILFEWLEGDATYTFVDYTMDELAASMKEGMETYYKEVNINGLHNLDRGEA